MTTIESVGWVLLHFVWQGVAIAMALAALLALTSTTQAKVRYVLSCTTLALMIVSPTLTAMSVFQNQGLPAVARSQVNASATSIGAVSAVLETQSPTEPPTATDSSRTRHTFAELAFNPRSPLSRVKAFVGPVMPGLVALWALGVLLLSVRLVGGWWKTRGLRLDGVSPAPAWCEARLAELAARLQISRPVTIVSSIRVAVPIVLGHVRPVIVVPAAVIGGMHAAQLEAIIAHELAHVRRHDYLVNLIQTVVETLLFYHPAVWWVSRQVRDTREHCCDDLAVTVCASREGYVRALLGLEELRTPHALLAPAATGGTLLTRARRLLIEPEARPSSPRLAASVIALTVVAAAAASASVAPAPPEATDAIVGIDSSPFESGNSPVTRSSSEGVDASPQGVQDVPASSIAQSPDTTGPLANRWAWAERAARDARHQRYWIGYSFSPVRTVPAIVYLDRLNSVFGDSMQFSGHLFSTVGKGLTFPGRRLVVPAPEGSLKMLLALETVRGAAVVTAVHVSSIALPVDTKDLPVYWLGQVDGSQSIASLGRFYDRASTQKLQSDVMAAIGVHDASNEIVAWLERRIASDDADDLRGDAAEWIAWHPIARSVTILDRTARGDRSVRVRQEAAEGLGDLALPEAAPVLIALARSRQDTATRMEAVEALGARSEPAALEALDAIARQDDVMELRREAVETLGDLSHERGVPTLMQLARTHPEAEVRREAVETLGDAQPTPALIDLLKGFALGDQDLIVQTEAIETLADLPNAAGLPTLLELVQSHPQPNARREVVESLGDLATSQAEKPSADQQKIVDLLTQLAKSDRDVDVQAEATETLGDIGTPDAIAKLQELARTHPDERIRGEAIESLGDTTSPDLAQLLKSIAIEDKSPQVQHEAIETLEGLPDGAGIEALLALAREHPDTRARKDALEALIESEQPRAREVVERFLKQAGR